jgi:hypothetical protein
MNFPGRLFRTVPCRLIERRTISNSTQNHRKKLTFLVSTVSTYADTVLFLCFFVIKIYMYFYSQESHFSNYHVLSMLNPYWNGKDNYC